MPPHASLTLRLLATITLITFVALPVSATVLVDELLQEDKITTETAHSVGATYRHREEPFTFLFNQIQRYPSINYVATEFTGDKMPVGISEDGKYPFTYTGLGYTGDGVVYINRNRNILGSVTSTQYTWFFYDWNIGSRTGATMITTNIPISLGSCYLVWNQPKVVITDDFGVYVMTTGYDGQFYAGWCKTDTEYWISVVSVNHWKNQLRVTDDHPNLYTIELTRDISSVASGSYISTDEWYNYGLDDLTWQLSKTETTFVNVTNIFGTVYLYSLSSGTDPSQQNATISLYIRSSQTGSLIPGAQAIVLDSQTGTTLINNTLASGTGTFDLEKSHTLRYLASATAEGYSLLSPIQFGVGDSGVSIVLWMAPIAAPTPPENTTEGKTLLYGYLITQGSSQPIPGATVTLSGIGSTTTSSTGSYLFNNIDPGTYSISASAPNHDPITESVTAEITATPHNLALKGHYILKVTVKDADTLKTLTNATTISLSDGQEHNDQNPTSFAIDYGTYTITAAAEGYYPLAQNQYIDKVGETVATILMTPKTPPPPTQPPKEMPNYPPHNVRFHCIDDYGLPLPNVTISAEYLETTSPWSWFTDLLGIPSTVNINATTLRGTTGSDGSITFSMIESVRYAITAHDPASNLTVNFTLYPQETQYTIQFRTRPPAPAETYPLYELEAVPLDGDTQVSLNLAYRDRDNGTTSLSFWVKDAAGELIYTSAPTLKLMGWTNTSYTVQNQPTSYTWGFDATHTTSGDISAARSITLHGSGRLVDLGLEDDFWYYLLSAVWIVALGAIFSGSRVRFGAIIIPLIGGGIPTLIGWLPLATIPLIGILTFIGVFVYMRKSEYKLYR